MNSSKKSNKSNSERDWDDEEKASEEEEEEDEGSEYSEEMEAEGEEEDEAYQDEEAAPTSTSKSEQDPLAASHKSNTTLERQKKKQKRQDAERAQRARVSPEVIALGLVVIFLTTFLCLFFMVFQNDGADVLVDYGNTTTSNRTSAPTVLGDGAVASVTKAPVTCPDNTLLEYPLAVSYRWSEGGTNNATDPLLWMAPAFRQAYDQSSPNRTTSEECAPPSLQGVLLWTTADTFGADNKTTISTNETVLVVKGANDTLTVLLVATTLGPPSSMVVVGSDVLLLSMMNQYFETQKSDAVVTDIVDCSSRSEPQREDVCHAFLPPASNTTTTVPWNDTETTTTTSTSGGSNIFDTTR